MFSRLSKAVVLLLLSVLVSSKFSDAAVLHGVRLGDFPAPDFKTTIKAVAAQSGTSSFRKVTLPSKFHSVPDLVRVYASTEDGDSSGFRFEGTGACQNSGSNGNYGGFIFAYNSKEVYIWTPTKYLGNSNGKLIYVEDGWGGEKYTQSSRVADLTIEAWNSLPTPNFHAEIQVDNSRRFYEVPHKLKQIPDFISVRVFSRNSYTHEKKVLFHFHAVGATQTPLGSTEYGGVVFAYNETFVRLWLPNTGDGLQTSCILITRGWGDGKFANQMNSNVCQVEIRAWINSFPLPVFQTIWKDIRANAHKKSFQEIMHNIKRDTLLVQVQVKKVGLKTSHFIYDGLGSTQSTQSMGGTYGGLLFAYDKEKIRVWVASSEVGAKGRAIFVSDAWGNGSQVEEHDRALFRIRIYANMCKNKRQIADGQGMCRDAGETGLIWQASPWGNCSKVCSDGIQRKRLTGCHAISLKSVFSCNFESDKCGFTSSHKWSLSKGSAEKELEPDGYMQPPYGYKKGSQFIYSVVKDLPGGSYVQLTSPPLRARKSCNLKFLYNTGVYYNYFEVHILAARRWFLAWSLSDKQPGNPYIWYNGYLNLEEYEVRQFRFTLRLRHSCLKHCGYVAFDDITLQCEAEEKTLVPLETCEKRAIPLPGCRIDVVQPLHKGKAFSIIKTDKEKYVRGNGTFSQHIATYRFKVEKDDVYIVWIEVLGLSFKDNSVSYYIDNYKEKVAHLSILALQPSWTWNCLHQEGSLLSAGIHLITFVQYDAGFTYRRIIVSPKRIASWSSLGMQNMHINDLQLRSSLNVQSLYAPHLRLNGKGAWETKDDNFGWLHWQINFPDVALVSRVAIQGGCRVPGQPICCAAQKFQLKFSIDGKNFSSYKVENQLVTFFKGSYKEAPNHVVETELNYAVPARAIRFLPYNSISYTCLRVEVYGTYMTKQMCTHTGLKPDLVRKCTGSRNCGKNAECVREAKEHDKESCKCLPGFHGRFCQHVGCAPNPCHNGGVCKLNNNNFRCICRPGYTGILCNMPCPSNKYGPGCNETCYCYGKSHCHPVTGACTCEPGFTGELCDTPCASGHFGPNCRNACKCSSLTVCDPVSGSCSCPFGFYGQFCDIPCKIGFYGRNCSVPCQCSRHSKCLPNNGSCVCPPGWFGKFCNKECPDGKFGKNCQYSCRCHGNFVCNKRDGSCTCKVGWRGEKCDRPCPPKTYGMGCSSNCSCSWDTTIRCDHVTGICICRAGNVGARCDQRCKKNTYGPSCTKRCKCRNDAVCDPQDGKCRCRNGFIGSVCQTPCPKGRYGKNCNNICRCVANHTQSCDNVDGRCDCLPGFKGKKCHKICKPGFWGKNCDFECVCHHGSHCDRMDGICTCTAGWIGATCDAPCDNGFYGPGCKLACQCQNRATCNRFNGSCSCSPGFVGKFCSERCPQWQFGKNCENECSCQRELARGCSNGNGTCFCKPGYKGENCEKDCQDGTYGTNCKLKCPTCPYHSTGYCDKVTGSCKCSPGYYGDLCQDYCPLGTFGDMCLSSCRCRNNEICNNINGECFDRSKFEFFMSIELDRNEIVSDDIFTRLAINLEKLMAKYYAASLQPVSRKSREVGHFEVDPDIEKMLADPGIVRSDDRTDDEESLVRQIVQKDKRNSFAQDLVGEDETDTDKSDGSTSDDGDFVGRRLSDELMLEKYDIDDQSSYPRHDIQKRDLTNDSVSINCIALSSPINVSSFSVRVTSKEKKFTENGKIVFKIGLVALYNTKPQGKKQLEKFVKDLPSGCLLIGTNCNLCNVNIGKTYDEKATQDSINIWIIVGASSGGFILCLALAVYLIIQRKRYNIVPTIYKVKKNSRDIELRPCLANGDGGHVLAFENPYYDVIAAMGLDDDIEEDYYNPLYTYDDVSLYCDDQASDSGTETNNDDGYQYPYDRDSGISSGTIHQ